MSYSRTIRTRKKLDQRSDDWLMTYADMITLLLCFFIVLAGASYVHKQKKTTEVVAKHEEPKPVPVLPIEEQLARLHLDIEKQEPVTAEAQPEVAVIVASQTVGEPALPNPPPPPAVTEEGAKGDRITIIEISSAAMFDSASAVLSDQGRGELQSVTTKLKDEAYKDYRITVEGHTDDAPITTAQYPSNWELSTARAAAVVRYFLEQGIVADKLRAAGYADTFPKAPNRDANGQPIPGNQAQNRRVVIKLEKIEGSV